MDSYWEGYQDMENKEITKEEKAVFDMINEMVNAELDSMDMEGLVQYATDKLWEYYSAFSDEEIKEGYEEYFNE